MKIKEMYKNENKRQYATDCENLRKIGYWYDDPIELVNLHLEDIIELFDHDSNFTPEECKKVLYTCIDEYINHMIKQTGNKNINRDGVTPNRELIIDELEAKVTN